ncbi:MAG: hypothetical protein KDB61_06220, partial [Planctomycetes bacterium]|nr:hypothetical protein [Planctomycetota bacterium]
MITNKLLAGLLSSAALATVASAQTTLHYWDFSTQDDSVGGLVGTAVGTPDLSIHALYGEAYPGAGPSLNGVLGGHPAGGGSIDADVFNGTSPTAMNFGSSDF